MVWRHAAFTTTIILTITNTPPPRPLPTAAAANANATITIMCMKAPACRCSPPLHLRPPALASARLLPIWTLMPLAPRRTHEHVPPQRDATPPHPALNGHIDSNIQQDSSFPCPSSVTSWTILSAETARYVTRASGSTGSLLGFPCPAPHSSLLPPPSSRLYPVLRCACPAAEQVGASPEPPMTRRWKARARPFRTAMSNSHRRTRIGIGQEIS